jgi:3'-5' exoribonuclease
MTVNGFYLIRDREIKQAANGSLYANFTLLKQHTILSARLWDITDDQQDKFVPKAIVKIEGKLETFRSKQQVTIQKIRLATEEDGINRTELVSKKGVSREDLWHELRMIMEEIQSPVLQLVIKKLYGDRSIRERFTTIPAAKKLHHAYYAGLLEQTVELAAACLQLLPLYPDLDKDVALATCLLGDIGKVKALEDPFAPEYTSTGELIGHLALSSEMISQAANEQGLDVNDQKLLAVKHGILAQYGETESGLSSTVQAKTKEALFYYYIKRMNTELRALQQAEGGEEDFVYLDLFKRKMAVGKAFNQEEEAE